MTSIAKWWKQLFCTHSHCSWTTSPVTETLSKTTGGCADCGKRISPTCERCGR